MYTANDHVFAVCAYGESPYLHECLASLAAQAVKSSVIVCTATPNDHIRQEAACFNFPVFENEGPHGIAEDWNFAYHTSSGRLVTLAHQDDVYESDYLAKMLERFNRARKPLIGFSDYFELRNGERSYAEGGNRNLIIKKWMLMPLRLQALSGSRLVRRRILSLGSPICCPSVTYVKRNLPETVFESHFLADLDWQAWEKLSRLEGDFCYIPKPLMGHRIHAESATSSVIESDQSRSGEDLEMFRRFWPEGIARLLNHFYASAQKGNTL